jgi:heme-degrading monooxygenase HmoA
MNNASSLSHPNGAIARIWRARATSVGFAAYRAHMTERVFPVLAKIPGFRGGCVLREESARGEGIHREPFEVQVITFWDSFDAIRAFAGTECDRAVVEPEAQAALGSCDEFVRHFTIGATCSGARFQESGGR